MGRDIKGQRVPAEIYVLKELSLGNVDFENAVLVAIDFQDVKRDFGSDVQFILGANVISQVNWMIDLKSNHWSILRLSTRFLAQSARHLLLACSLQYVILEIMEILPIPGK